MVGPKHLKTPTSQPSVSHPAQTDDLLKLLAAMQDGLYDLSQVLSSSLISILLLCIVRFYDISSVFFATVFVPNCLINQKILGKNNKTGAVSPNEAALKAPLSNASYNLQKTSPPSSYKIVPNKIIQHNVTSASKPITSSGNFMTSSTNVSSAPSGPMGSFAGPLTGNTEEDKIKPIIDLVKKLVAGKFYMCTIYFVDY